MICLLALVILIPPSLIVVTLVLETIEERVVLDQESPLPMGNAVLRRVANSRGRVKNGRG